MNNSVEDGYKRRPGKEQMQEQDCSINAVPSLYHSDLNQPCSSTQPCKRPRLTPEEPALDEKVVLIHDDDDDEDDDYHYDYHDDDDDDGGGGGDDGDGDGDRPYHHCEKIEGGEQALLRNDGRDNGEDDVDDEYKGLIVEGTGRPRPHHIATVPPIANSSYNKGHNGKVLIKDSPRLMEISRCSRVCACDSARRQCIAATSSSSHLYPIGHPPTLSTELYLFPLNALHGPLWLKHFISTRYFIDPCPLHHKLIKYFKWDFTRGAGKGLCIKCKQSYRSSPSSICLQVRRASNLDSIKKDELTQYIDTRGIFTFIINGEDIHYLRTAYPIKEQKGARAYCMACRRALKEKREDEVVCSIQCKLIALKRGIMPTHLSRLEITAADNINISVDANNIQANDSHDVPPNHEEQCMSEVIQLLQEHEIDVRGNCCILKLYLKLEGFDESSITEDWKSKLLEKLRSKDLDS